MLSAVTLIDGAMTNESSTVPVADYMKKDRIQTL